MDETQETSGSFDRFTERGRKVLTLAAQEAQRFNHNYIGTEHLLLGLVREGEGVAGRVLRDLGVDLQKVRSGIEFIIGRGERSPSGEIGLTPRAKKVIELAVDESRRLGHHYIGTEHLLLGLIREGEGIASGILESLGVSLEKTRSRVIKVLTEGGRVQAAAPTAPYVPDLSHYLFLHTAWRDGWVVAQSEGPGEEVIGMPIRAALEVLHPDGWELVGIDNSPAPDRESGATYVLRRGNRRTLMPRH